MKIKITVKPLDIVIFVLAIGALGFVVQKSYFNKADGEPVVSINANGTEYIYPLSKKRTVEVEGFIGVSIIQIEDNTARFVSSPCGNHICEMSDDLTKPGDWSACLPNKIFMRINSDANTIDALTN